MKMKKSLDEKNHKFTMEFIPTVTDKSYSLTLVLAIHKEECSDPNYIKCDRQQYEYFTATIVAACDQTTTRYFSMDPRLQSTTESFTELKKWMDGAQYIYCYQSQFVLGVLCKPYLDLTQ